MLIRSVYACLGLWLLGASVSAAETGQAIYKTKCASCHGANGEGSKTYKRSLEGDRSVKQLAAYIAESMPEDDPGSLSAEDSEKVAAYMHDAFYSPIARERNKPARVELRRLTVRQYRNAITDLIHSFQVQQTWDDKRGLNAEYYKNRRFRPNDRVLERIDPKVEFHFEKNAPVPEVQAHEFSIRWTGSVLAPETGYYDFVVRTEHAARLWVNDNEKPIIDAWVKSGHDTEYKASIYLLGGRPYPLKLEFSKAKQGVDDSKKQKQEPPIVPASIELCWKPPLGVTEPIPNRLLSPKVFSEWYVVPTPFPPDDSSLGWERGSSVSKEWDQAITDAALDVASFVAMKYDKLANLPEKAADRDAKIRSFCQTFVTRAFRRPLTEEQKKIYIDRPLVGANDVETAIKRVVLFALKSPRFLYREVGTEFDPYDVACRLSFGLWDSIPDQKLLDAAAKGQLTTPEQIRNMAEQMLGDLRTKTKLRGFFRHWLNLEHANELSKDPKRFAEFNPAIVADLRISLDLFLDDIIWQDASDFRQLFLTNETFLNGRLAKFYGVLLPEDSDFRKVTMDIGRRSGVLTHPLLMTANAYTAESSPIHRGVFLARGVFGQSLRPPPEAVAPLPADLHPNLNTRERVTLQTKATSCMTCHGVINPLGFTLEHFDAVGRYREQDNGKPILADGSYLKRDGQTVKLNGAVELAKFLADSEEVHEAFTEQLFHHVAQQPIRAYGPNTLSNLRNRFAQNKFNIQKLLVETAVVTALPPKRSKP